MALFQLECKMRDKWVRRGVWGTETGDWGSDTLGYVGHQENSLMAEIGSEVFKRSMI